MVERLDYIAKNAFSRGGHQMEYWLEEVRIFHLPSIRSQYACNLLVLHDRPTGKEFASCGEWLEIFLSLTALFTEDSCNSSW